MNILEVKSLTKKFNGVAAISDLSVEIESGKITGIIGPNGSGKTTLTNILSGMTPMTHGAVSIKGIAVKGLEAADIRSYGITRTFQEVRLFNQMPASDNVLVALTERHPLSALLERRNPLHEKRVEELLRRVNLWEKRQELAVNLSYGQRKLLEIARALAMDSDIYLFDEPFAGMFPEMVKIVVDILKQLRTEEKTVLLIEHNMELIRELSDHIIVMDSGKLLAKGNPADVLKRREVMEAYLGE